MFALPPTDTPDIHATMGVNPMDYWLIPNNYQCNCNSQNPTIYRFYYDAITEINWYGECVDGKCAGSFTIDMCRFIYDRHYYGRPSADSECAGSSRKMHHQD